MNPRSNGSLIAIIIVLIAVVVITIVYAFRVRAAETELAQEISPDNPEIAEPYIVGRHVTSTSTRQWLFCYKKVHLDAILDFHMLVGGKSAYQLFLERYAMQIDPETGWFRCGYASGKVRWQIVEAWSPKPCFLEGKLRSCTVMVMRLAVPNYPDGDLWSNYHVFTDRKVLRIPPGERVWSDPLGMFRPTAQGAVGHTFFERTAWHVLTQHCPTPGVGQFGDLHTWRSYRQVPLSTIQGSTLYKIRVYEVQPSRKLQGSTLIFNVKNVKVGPLLFEVGPSQEVNLAVRPPSTDTRRGSPSP